MGYIVHITRRANWWDEHGPDISTREWEDVVDVDPDLVMIPMPEGGWTDGPPRWIAVLGGGAEAMAWQSGSVMARYPSDVMIAKMVVVARALGARVQGDDGEFYTG
ncbi:hypothetical protein SRB5_59930 [Streptomyces sp. RB5]|uniref:Uncharacterized protein n=1 Tax=Streptomyces smaragdinus TaxID=2585196 RepID=A0A7K0CS31_9ACTN|nr:hypothetical protein [Streptomyces smaragdinus]MQY15802.1 hypothetical protein [Streptomyces smaragdinus]